MDLNRLYDVVYELQQREHFARNLQIIINRDDFKRIHLECARRREHTRTGARYFLELNIDGVCVGWAPCIPRDCYCAGRVII